MSPSGVLLSAFPKCTPTAAPEEGDPLPFLFVPPPPPRFLAHRLTPLTGQPVPSGHSSRAKRGERVSRHAPTPLRRVPAVPYHRVPQKHLQQAFPPPSPDPVPGGAEAAPSYSVTSPLSVLPSVAPGSPPQPLPLAWAVLVASRNVSCLRATATCLRGRWEGRKVALPRGDPSSPPHLLSKFRLKTKVRREVGAHLNVPT